MKITGALLINLFSFYSINHPSIMTKSTKKLQAIEYLSKAMVLVATAPSKDKYADALQDLMFISTHFSLNEIKEVKEYLINRATKENAPITTIDNLKNLFPYLDSF